MKKILAMILVAMMMLSCVVVTSAADTKSANIAGLGEVVVEQKAPVSGGNRRFPKILTDGRIPTKEEPYIMQWDTYRGGSAERDTWFGVTFDKEYTLTGVDFTEGLHYAPASGMEGGWFANGIRVEVLVGTEWTPVALTNDPKYPISNTMADFGEPYETYELRIAPTACLGIRVIGAAGGPGLFASCSELAVWADVPTAFEVVDPWLKAREDSAKERYETKRYLEGYATPITDGATYGNSGCSHTLTTINDGVFVASDNTNLGLQFDTYNPNSKLDIEEYIGYRFDAPYKVESLKYQVGVHSASGGFFAFGFDVEALIHGEWVVLKNVQHEYPESNSLADFTSNATYDIEFDDVICEGIRLIGIAGGSKNYIGCSELAVIGDMNPDLTEYNGATNQPGGDNGGDNGAANEDEGTKKPAADDKEDKADATTAAATTAKKADATTAAAEKKSGCGSVIGMSAVAMVAILGGAVLTKKKEN